jgi:hypothetical protein
MTRWGGQRYQAHPEPDWEGPSLVKAVVWTATGVLTFAFWTAAIALTIATLS